MKATKKFINLKPVEVPKSYDDIALTSLKNI